MLPTWQRGQAQLVLIPTHRVVLRAAQEGQILLSGIGHAHAPPPETPVRYAQSRQGRQRDERSLTQTLQ